MRGGGGGVVEYCQNIIALTTEIGSVDDVTKSF